MHYYTDVRHNSSPHHRHRPVSTPPSYPPHLASPSALCQSHLAFSRENSQHGQIARTTRNGHGSAQHTARGHPATSHPQLRAKGKTRDPPELLCSAPKAPCDIQTATLTMKNFTMELAHSHGAPSRTRFFSLTGSVTGLATYGQIPSYVGRTANTPRAVRMACFMTATGRLLYAET